MSLLSNTASAPLLLSANASSQTKAGAELVRSKSKYSKQTGIIYPFMTKQFPDYAGQKIWQYGFAYNGIRYSSMQYINTKSVYGSTLEEAIESSFVGGNPNGWNAIIHAWSNGKCCFAASTGPEIFTSSDGIQFTRSTSGLNGNDAGQSFPFIQDTVVWNYWSTTTTFGITTNAGVTVDVRTKPTSSYVLLCGSNLLIAFVPNSTAYHTSTDGGLNWTSRTAPSNSFSGRIYCSVSQTSGAIVITSDLISGYWISVNGGVTFTLYPWKHGITPATNKTIYFNGHWVFTYFSGGSEVRFIKDDGGMEVGDSQLAFVAQMRSPIAAEKYLSVVGDKLIVSFDTAGTGTCYVINPDFTSYASPTSMVVTE